MNDTETLLWFEDLSISDISSVGGKNASLGELINNLQPLGVQVPPGFALTVSTFNTYLEENSLSESIFAELDKVDLDDLSSLQKISGDIRDKVANGSFSVSVENEIVNAYEQLLERCGDITVAVRSSATAEDLPNASFAGQQDTLLNVSGKNDLLKSIKSIYASLFTARAISYRNHQGFTHREVGLSVGVQMMVRSDLSSSGVMFSIDTESGSDKVVFISASYGLGELIVQGEVNPDEYYVDKRAIGTGHKSVVTKRLGSKLEKMIYNSAPKNIKDLVLKIPVEEKLQNSFVLNEEELEYLAKHAMAIEKHYKRPMDIEWAKDGNSETIYIVQARPETVASQDKSFTLEKYILKEKGTLIVRGRSVGQKIGQGRALVVKNIDDIGEVNKEDVLVTDMTDPDWEPVMKKVSAIVTNRGGRTCHAAIIARELGIPAIVGCEDATTRISNKQLITASCAEGDTGNVYDGALNFDVLKHEIDKMPKIDFKIMMNVGDPSQALALSKIPNEGVGLARMEFVINHMIGIHPQACLDYPRLPKDIKDKIEMKTRGYGSPRDFYVKKIAEGMSLLAVAFWPKPVIVRLSDFKSNEYANLLGGDLYEPTEENPMIGFRGASRYVDDKFKKCFELECEAIKIAREQHGLINIQVMLPFVRTLIEARSTISVMEEFGIKRGEHELKLIMMCEIPSNAILAKEF
ncbi:MAG: phosphoenolpyruvate synthase, partial [Francisellaceae bacterium]|nr:phosphoenolpyruvate synthase [Francisellaceae bacterium]